MAIFGKLDVLGAKKERLGCYLINTGRRGVWYHGMGDCAEGLNMVGINVAPVP
jgi:hypothetical protein